MKIAISINALNNILTVDIFKLMVVVEISFHSRLNNLEKVNNNLKSRLLHERIRHDNYSYNDLENEFSLVLGAYKTHKSIVLAASSVGIDGNVALKWFFEGLRGNSIFKNFYLGIIDDEKPVEIVQEEDNNEYEIQSVGNTWIYTTSVDGERVSIISSDFENLKEKVKRKDLPPID